MDEDPAQYEAYREGMKDCLRPMNTLERTLAHRITLSAWRLQRAERTEAAFFNQDMAKAHHIATKEMPPEYAQEGHEPPHPILVGAVFGEAMSGPSNRYETLRRYERTIDGGSTPPSASCGRCGRRRRRGERRRERGEGKTRRGKRGRRRSRVWPRGGPPTR